MLIDMLQILIDSIQKPLQLPKCMELPEPEHLWKSVMDDSGGIVADEAIQCRIGCFNQEIKLIWSHSGHSIFILGTNMFIWIHFGHSIFKF